MEIKTPKWMQLPRIVLVGRDVINDTSKVLIDLGFSKPRVIIVSGPNTIKIAGKKVEEAISEVSSNVSKVIINAPKQEEIDKVKRDIAKQNADIVFGVGGGTVIDVAKLASTQSNIPFISVPTAASHDGISSPRASIKDSGGPVSIAAQAPLAIIADTDIIVKAPYRLLAAGCGDIIAKYTAIKDWELANRLRNEPFSEYAAALALMTAKIIIDFAKEIQVGSEESVRIVVKALISSGVAISIAGSSRPASGSEHLFSHALDVITPKPALHGEQCGVGTIMMMYLHRGNWKAIRNALKIIGAPINAEGLGIEPKYIIEALVKASTIRPRYTILGEKGLTHDAAERLATITEVI